MSQNLLHSLNNAEDLAMVDVAYLLLNESTEPISFQHMVNEIARIKNMSTEAAMDTMSQLYTEINLDGRFVYIGNSLWGLKSWYPIDQFDDPTLLAPPRKKKAKVKKAKDLDDFDDIEDLEDYEDLDEFDDDFEEDEDEDDDDLDEDDDDLDRDYDEDEEEVIDEDEDVDIEFDDDDVSIEADESLEGLAEEELEEDEDEEL